MEKKHNYSGSSLTSGSALARSPWGHLIGGEGRCLLSSGDQGGGIIAQRFREPKVSLI